MIGTAHNAWLTAIALLASTALGCGESAAASKGPAQDSTEARAGAAHGPRQVRLAKVSLQKLTKSISVGGTLAPDEQVTVGIKVAGRLASISVDLGTVVKRGQSIAEVEPTDYRLRAESAQSALLQARAQLGLSPEGDDTTVDIANTSVVQEAKATFEEARANLDRSRSLIDQRLIAPAEFDTVKASFLRAQTGVAKAEDEIRNREAMLRQRSFELRAARQQLGDTVIRSPLDGIVQERHALAGEYLVAGAAVATIVSVNPLRMRAEIPERDAALVRAGQSVRVHVNGDADDDAHADPNAVQHLGHVVRLAPALNEQNRSLVIEAEIENPGTLRPGSFARAEIVVDGAEEVLVVPTSAVVNFAGIEKVITIEKGKAVEKEIEAVRRNEQWTEVVSGVAAGDSVVIEPGNLQHGQPVSVASAP